ncbi:MAG TPA: bifunctional adenosylcobinamide kinase/adenosylcobinamide-phosphate guanylyltransferase, partial [Pyrinomonadaceae bacterium]|nr:bifunctional adenosylcobinamide kinase/adenosylcobinamide-phosphate guanylyltransferase [Pyrinomonadaceae bacterium]
PLNPADYLRNSAADDSVVLIDCVTVWLSNLMWEYRAESREAIENSVLQKVEEFAFAARNRQVVAVSNEVGGGIVPDNPLARSFRDVQGLANQILAREAERVVIVIAGLPLTLKG